MTITEPTPLALRPGRWGVDHAHSSIGFAIRHLGVSKVRGRFVGFDAELHVGPTLDGSWLTATVDLATIDTGNTDRDDHCRSADILDVARRPTMTFRSTDIVGDGDAWAVDGELTIGTVTRPFSLAVEFGGVEPFVDGRVHAGFEARGDLSRREFGIDVALPPGVGAAMLGDTVKVQLDIQLVEPPASDM